MNIFDELKKNNVCFAVVKSTTRLKKSINYMGNDWFILTNEKDKEITKPLGFKAENGGSDKYTRTMNEAEIEAFKLIEDKFVKVYQGEDGRVWEQKNKSFKKHYKLLRKEVDMKR